MKGTCPQERIQPPTWRRLVLGVFFLALTLRLVYFAQSRDNPLLYLPILDEAYYMDLGKSIAGGFLMGEGRVFFMDPLYGYFLGLCFFLFGENLTTIRLIQILLDSLNVPLIYLLGTRLWSRSAGILAALIYALYKVAFFYTLLILKTTLSINLSLLFVLALFHTIRSRRSIYWLALGCFAGLLVYLRANFLLFAPLTILLQWFLRSSGWKPLLRQSLVFAAGFLICLLPGAVRNHAVSGEWIFLNAQSGRLLYSCNNPDNLTGRYNVPSFSRPHPEDSDLDFRKEAEQRLGRRLGAGEVSRYWTRETLRQLAENPRAVPVLLKNKLRGTVGNYEIPVNHSFETAGRFSSLSGWPLPTFALALALGVPGLIMGFRRNKEAACLFVPVLVAVITSLTFYASSRFRMPAVPFLLVGAGICLAGAAEMIGKRAVKRTGVLGVIAGFLFVISLTASFPRDTGADAFHLAKAYWSQGRYGEARAAASEGAARFPEQARFPTLLGMIALSEDRPEEAAAQNLRALSIDPHHADAYHNLGLVYLLRGRPRKAAEVLEKAVSLGSDPRYLFTLARACEEMGERVQAIAHYRRYLDISKPAEPYRKQARARLSELEGGGGQGG